MDAILDRPREPTRHWLSVDQYYEMAKNGILKPDDQVELIEGEIIDMAPIGAEHAGNTNRLARLFARAVVDGVATISVQAPLRLDPYNKLKPDVMLLRPQADDYRGRHPTAADVLLLVEVSDSSLQYDRGRKLTLYAGAGVPEACSVSGVRVIGIAGRPPVS